MEKTSDKLLCFFFRDRKYPTSPCSSFQQFELKDNFFCLCLTQQFHFSCKQWNARAQYIFCFQFMMWSITVVLKRQYRTDFHFIKLGGGGVNAISIQEWCVEIRSLKSSSNPGPSKYSIRSFQAGSPISCVIEQLLVTRCGIELTSRCSFESTSKAPCQRFNMYSILSTNQCKQLQQLSTLTLTLEGIR